MIKFLSEDEVVTAVPRLTHAQLISFVETRIVMPMESETGPVYRRRDLVRIELLCDLSEQFDLKDDALGVVISLVDQLHGVRAELKALVEAIAQERAEVAERVRKAAGTARTGK